LVLAVSHPSPKVRRLAKMLEGELCEVVETADELIRKLLDRPPGTQSYVGWTFDKLLKVADEWHREARQTLRELLDVI
jgi:hypothetical protein